MNILILTSSFYKDFVLEVVGKERNHTTFTYFLDSKFEFEGFWSYDIGISFMYLHKVPAEQVNSHPWFNFHPAPLPEYRGRDLCYHAIMNGEKEFGATLHYMDENFDTGDIIEVGKFPIFPDWTAGDLSYWTIAASKNLFIEYFPRILETPVFPRIPNVGGVYYKKGNIVDELPLHDVPLARWIRAVTYKDFHPRVDIGGVKYKIVREE